MHKRSFCRAFIFLMLISGIKSANAQLVVNEWSASNISTILDNNNSYSDWIELYNAGGTPVNLAGYHLSDMATNPAKWTFTSGTIAANSVLLIWATGNNVGVGPNYHTNFGLTQTKPGKMIILADPSGTILDSMTLRPAQKDHSRGRMTNGNTTWGVFTTPTPGTNNVNAKQNYAATPAMSVSPGFYGGAQSVTLSTPDPNITIRYTTDGSTPVATSTAYSTPITISATTVLRARAFSSTPTIPESFVNSNTYFINVTHTLPVTSIFGDQILTLMNGTQILPETGIEYFDKTGAFKTESYGTSNKHGNDSWFYPQRGIDFITYDEYGYNYQLKNQFFTNTTRTGFRRVIIKAAANDNYPFENPGNPYSWGPSTQLGSCNLRDAYVQVLSQQAKLHMDARSCVFCQLYVNGQYWGVYDLREKVDDKDFTNHYYLQNTPKVEMLQTWGGTWEAYSPSPGVTQSDWNALVNYITTNNMAIPANYLHVDSLYSVKSLADYLVMNTYTVCSDWLVWNTEWWRGLDPLGGHKKWGYCLWDEDATFGHYIDYTGIGNNGPNANPCTPMNLNDPGGQGHIPVLNALMNSPIFRQYYISRFIDLSNTYFNCTFMNHVLDSMILVIQPEMAAQCSRWGGNVPQWQSNVTAMKGWINQRCADISAGLDSCFSLIGPFPMVFDVMPPLSGTMNINSIHPMQYAFSGNYFGNVNILLDARANAGYTFDYWEYHHGTLTPTINDTAVALAINQGDTVIAHFRLINPPPPPPVEGAVAVPNAFSPNGDGNNDILFVLGTNVEKFELNIYNRWGQKVFYTNDQAIGWDGTFKGQKENNGVFAYSLVYTTFDHTQHSLKGNITLIR